MSGIMAKKFVDYDGPTGLFVATKEGIKPLQDPAALVALADSAMLTSLGYTKLADAYELLVNEPAHPVAP
jgi:hypothetical protein